MVLEQRELRQLFETAVVAARLAGQRAIEELGYIKVSVKNNSELLTQADSICQQIIVDKIKETYPDHGFICEEAAGGEIFKQSPRQTNPVWWVIDPIDGTNNFAHGMLLFAVSIAVMYEGEPIVGVIFDPTTDSMFTAVKGDEAKLNGRRIEVSKETIDQFSSVGFDSHFGKNVPDWALELMLKTRFRNLGSTALQLAYVGRGGLIVTIAHTPKLWDIAAGSLIVETAGGILSDWQGGKIYPVDLEKYQGRAFKILAANKKVHPQIVELLKS